MPEGMDLVLYCAKSFSFVEVLHVLDCIPSSLEEICHV
jgi:hypothetical protein